MLSMLLMVIGLSFLVIIHELGHFFLARKLGFQIEEFGFGYPPRLKQLFKWQGTIFSLNWIPFGGFVRLYGEYADSDDLRKLESTDLKKPTLFFVDHPLLNRLLVIFAGPLTNFLFAWLAYSMIFLFSGIPTDLSNFVQVDQVAENSPAYDAGVKKGMRFMEVEQNAQWMSVNSISDVQNVVNAHLGENLKFKLIDQCSSLDFSLCDSSKIIEKNIYVRSQAQTPNDQGPLGIAFLSWQLESYPWYKMPFLALQAGLSQTWYLSRLMISGIGQVFYQLIFMGQLQADVAGPLGIVNQAKSIGLSEQGWDVILGFLAMISLNLAIVNLLPIPALDGGRILSGFIELMVGKKIAFWLEEKLNYFGFAFLLVLIILITVKDLRTIF